MIYIYPPASQLLAKCTNLLVILGRSGHWIARDIDSVPPIKPAAWRKLGRERDEIILERLQVVIILQRCAVVSFCVFLTCVCFHVGSARRTTAERPGQDTEHAHLAKNVFPCGSP